MGLGHCKRQWPWRASASASLGVVDPALLTLGLLAWLHLRLDEVLDLDSSHTLDPAPKVETCLMLRLA
jgi:hypothetical protein